MAMIDRQVLDRVEGLITKGEAVIRSKRPNPPNVFSAHTWVEGGLFSEWRNQSVSFLTSILGQTHAYAVSFIDRCKDNHLSDTNYGVGILRAVREDVQAGYLVTLRELVHADVFSDFLEMAEYLMDEDHGYKDAAAVLAGGVLEEHLRQLYQRQTMSIEVQTANGTKPKKADTMNADLAAATVYNKNQQKIVTGWLGIRNSAAHAKYGEYTTEQVVSLIGGVRDFIARFPA
jgi:hypothetical protein